MDNGLLIELSLKGQGLDERKHFRWRSVALVVASLRRVVLLFMLSALVVLQDPLPHSWWSWTLELLNPGDHHLTWMNLTFLMGGLIIIAMAFWELYHKYRELRYDEEHPEEASQASKATPAAVVRVVLYLLLMNLIFSLDSVFTSVAMMDLKTQLGWMVAAILVASSIMIVGMVPLSWLISQSQHFSVTMLVILVLIAAKLMADGVGGHFPNSVLILMLVAIFANDGVQAFFDRAAEAGRMARKRAQVPA